MQEKIKVFKAIALDVASNSPDKRQKVGAIIFNEKGQVIASGYNSKPIKDSTYSDCVDPFTNKSYTTLLHAEEACLLRLKDINPKSVYFMYVTHCPCLRCASRILFCESIKHVYFTNDHDNNEGMEYLIKNGINVTKVG